VLELNNENKLWIASLSLDGVIEVEEVIILKDLGQQYRVTANSQFRNRINKSEMGRVSRSYTRGETYIPYVITQSATSARYRLNEWIEGKIGEYDKKAQRLREAIGDKLDRVLDLLVSTEADNGDPMHGFTPVVEQYKKDADIENLVCNIFNLVYNEEELWQRVNGTK
jgi:hypothetical protein